MEKEKTVFTQVCGLWCATKGNVRVVFVNLGEGYSGDYNPNDPDDEPLLRFDVYAQFGDTWASIDDGSYCTCFSARADSELQKKAVEKILNAVYPVLSVNPHASVKHVLEPMTFISDVDFEEV